MAEKKTATKKTANSVKKATEVKSLEELKKELTVKQNELFETRRSHQAGELINPRALTMARKEIARLKTAIRALELKGDK